MWLGIESNKTMEFRIPDTYKKYCRIDDNGQKFGKVPAISWFTNISHNKRNQPLDLYKKYNPKDFPKYDNYNAIEVSKVKDIPKDYYGNMGVPITFLNKYCPDQFEIIDKLYPFINKKRIYQRLIIKRKI